MSRDHRRITPTPCASRGPHRPVTAALVCAVALAGCGEPTPARAPSLASRVVLAAGNVQVKQGDSAWQQAIAGLLLRHGTTVRVGTGDRALIRLDDGSAVFLRHGTEVTLARDGLQLAKGEIWVDAPAEEEQPARYRAGEVIVSAAAAGLDLARAGGEVKVYVARGLAVVAAPGGRREVPAGERALVAGKQAPKVDPVAFWEDWTGGMADRPLAAGEGGAGSGHLYAIDRSRPGALPQGLEIRVQQVNVAIRDGVARTTVDQRFFNPSSTQVEGYYWFTIPEDAAVDRFALEVQGALIDGEVVERKQARAAYEEAIRSALDPALLEWVDGRTYRARIYPIPPAGERRVVLSYIQLLPTVDKRTHYVYPMGGVGERIQEFALSVDLGDEGEKMKLATTADARVEAKGRRVSMRRSGFKPTGDFLLEMVADKEQPLRAARVESSRAEAAYVMLRYVPDVAWDEVKQVSGDVVVVVDTSAGGDDADRQLRAEVAEAILRALSTGDRFALVAADLTPRVLYPDQGLARADEASVGKALERLSSVPRQGATDLGALFHVALERLHGAAQPAVVYVGDGMPTVGEIDADVLAKRAARTMAGSPARLFTIAVGSAAEHALLARLARIGGGHAFRVDVAQQAVQEALRVVGALKTPTITELKIDLGAGLDQAFSSAAGKVSRGEEVSVVARTHHALPDKVRISGRLAGKAFSKEYPLKTETGAEHAYVPKLWARRYLTQLMGDDAQENRGTIIRLGIDYALMTPFTSFLVLDSEDAYQRMGIQRKPRDPVWGVVPFAALKAAAAAPLFVFGCSAESQEAAPVAAKQVAPSTTEVTAIPGATASTRAPAAEPVLAAPAPPGAMGAQGIGRGGGGSASRYGMKARRRAKGMADGEGGAERNEQKEEALDALVDGAIGAGKRGPSGGAMNLTPTQPCSDAARRSLAHRRAIWLRQLELASHAADWVRVYFRARAHCELPHFSDRRELLDLVQERIATPDDARQVLAALRDDESRAFVQRRLLQRAVRQDLADAVSAADGVDWSVADAALARAGAPDQVIGELRKLCSQHPSSRACALRLIRALVAAKRTEEALAAALKLRADGMATPALMQQIGDLLASAGRAVEAQRAYSEVVEFAPGDPEARRLLGDIYLRHGWYEPAYRQYRTLGEMVPEDAMAQLRLASAAAGVGRVDEALRVERKISSAEGEPGPRDPRRWARHWSAARIAALMLSPAAAKSETMRQSMERSLRQLQVLASPGVLFVLTWEDLQGQLTFDVSAGGQPVPRTEQVDASPSGMLSISAPALQAAEVVARVARKGEAEGRPIAFRLAVIVWDGKRMRVTVQRGRLGGQPETLPLKLP